MKKFLSIASSAALVMVTSVAAVAPASAAPNNWQRQQNYVANWCQNNPRDRDCRDFNRNSRHWGQAQYGNWYRRHQHQRGFDPFAAGIFGFAAGAIIGGAAAAANANSSSSHIARCQANYRSYDVRTDTYLGYDGIRHRCTL